ncbi:unnamed protein product [Mytilus coruscus]|uniref:TRIM2_3 n=1 Tax=Mytilus coruscus TaxID=42192 RepID=A0A6J8C8J0_MYTCO|nr:unnamed protein product [Mytilus coruscus]
MKQLSEILKQVKSSASVQLLENDMKDVRENLDDAIKYLKTRICTINTQKTKAVEKIRQMRKSIDDYLNRLERKIFNDLESKHSKLKTIMNTIVQQMEQQSSQLDQMHRKFIKLTQHAPELQMYIGLREIEKSTSQTANYIEDSKADGHLNDKNLEANIASALQSILQDVKSFGEVNIITTFPIFKEKTSKKYEDRNLVSIFQGIEKIRPSLMRRLTIPEDMKSVNIWSCFVLPGGKLNIYDYNKIRLLLFSIDGIFIREVVAFTENIPVDACHVGKDVVSVALGSANQTVCFDVEKNKITKTFELSHDCDAVASDGHQMVISSIEKSTIVNLKDMSLTILESFGTNRIAVFKGNIYGTISYENKIFCYKTTGEPLWIFKHQDIRFLQGLTLDKNGFVYIASRGNNSIVVVSPDGKTCKTILSEADGVHSPYAIDINRETGLMLVSIEIRNDSDCVSYDSA